MILTFSEYIRKLHTYCGGDKTPSAFVVTVLENVIFNRDNDDLTQKVAAFNMEDNDLRKLYNGKKIISKTSARYILSHLDTQHFAEYITDATTDDARILLCKEFEPYIGNSDQNEIPTKIANLLAEIFEDVATRKHKSIEQSPLHPITKIDLEQELTVIVKTLAKLPIKTLNNLLTFEPYNVDKKILPENTTLKKQIKQDVVDYYLFLEKLFQDETAKNSLFFDSLAEKVKSTCDTLIEQGMPQEQIFDKMVAWFRDKALYFSQNSCRIITSFFVQNCEVFHAFTE